MNRQFFTCNGCEHKCILNSIRIDGSLPVVNCLRAFADPKYTPVWEEV